MCPTLPDPHELQHSRLLCPLPSPRVCPSSRPLNWWCHPSISSSVSPSPPAFSLSQHQGLYQWVSSLHQVAKVLELQHQSVQWIFRTVFLQDGLVGSPRSPRDSQEASPTSQFKSINSLVLSLLCGPAFTSIHDYWKNHNFWLYSAVNTPVVLSVSASSWGPVCLQCLGLPETLNWCQMIVLWVGLPVPWLRSLTHHPSLVSKIHSVSLAPACTCSVLHH